ncbi:8-amino-7-oxononanoate synthase [Candidatus Acetothermia bacterium]|nr:MAG: 8-amino-7-oxononanoate synthase [Candidatus Acetothermia bacterium]
MGEDDLAAAKREIREETGILDFQPIPGFRAISRYRFLRDGRPIDKEVVYFLARVPGEGVRISAEHSAAGWFSPEEAERALTYEQGRRILAGAEDYLTAGRSGGSQEQSSHKKEEEKAMEKFGFIDRALTELHEKGLYNTIRTIESPVEGWVKIEGKRVLNLCSNNYLGFANDPRLAEAAKRAIDEYGVGPGAVRSIAGTMSLHLELEEKLAHFKGTEAALSVQSGLNTNLAVIPLLMGKEDVIFTDELNHASIIDGVRLTKAQRVIYPHCDVDGLAKALEEHKDIEKKLIVTDGVFSMDGDLAPLPGIVELAEEYGAIVMVDDAHGEGVLGSHGRGIVDHFGLHDRVDIECGTMSKAFGVMGGYIAGPAKVIEYLRQRARPFLFSSAATPADVAACIAAVDILEKTDEPVRKLWENAEYFKSSLQELGFDTGHSETPITPVMLGEAKTAWDFSKRLFEEGVFATAIAFPTVPRGKARIRVMLSAAHTRDDLDFAIDAFAKVGRELGVIGR